MGLLRFRERAILSSAMRTLTLLACTSILAVPAFAQQEELHHHNITVAGGAATPLGNSTSYLSTAPAFNISYGYRFTRLFQVDTGLEMAFGAANNQNVEQTDLGSVQGGDHEFMVPLGGRVILPLP